MRAASPTTQRRRRRSTPVFVDRDKGVATAVGTKAFAPALAGSAFGFAVNPVADKVRVQSDFDQNLRIDPMTGAATSDGMLAFAAGDPNQFRTRTSSRTRARTA